MRVLGLVVLYIAVALFGAAALAKLPHVLYGKRIAGQVVNADTGQPIAGAHVVFSLAVADRPERIYRT